MKIAKLAAVYVTGALSVAAACMPAHAASPVTRFFMNNVAANLDFLEKSSRLALTHSRNPEVRAFAGSEAEEQAIAASAIDLWAGARKTPFIVVASVEPPLQTGRSVAVAEEQVMPDTRVPLGATNLDRLQSLSGTGFDNLYWQQQLDALKQVETDYVSYAADGDDPVLRAIAERELPKIERRLEALAKL